MFIVLFTKIFLKYFKNFIHINLFYYYYYYYYVVSELEVAIGLLLQKNLLKICL